MSCISEGIKTNRDRLKCKAKHVSSERTCVLRENMCLYRSQFGQMVNLEYHVLLQWLVVIRRNFFFIVQKFPLWLGCCKLENEILKEAKNLENDQKCHF